MSTSVSDTIPASTETGWSISVGGSASGYINSDADQDYFRIYLNAGEEYLLYADAVSLSDPTLDLRDSSGTSLVYNDDSGEGLDAQITYTAAVSGYYYLDVGGYFSHTGSYNLSAQIVNRAPTDVTLTGSSVVENSGIGTVVGVLTSTDLDHNNTHTYTLLDDAGGRFALSGNSIIVANGALLDNEQLPSHSVTVRSTDQGGLYVDRTLTISVQDVASEVAVGTSGNDTMLGGTGADVMSGGDGNDTLDGGAGADMLEGGAGDDNVLAGEGDDTIIAGHGGGNDTYSGGAGKDKITFLSALKGVAVSLKNAVAQGSETGRDTLKDIEDVVGGAGADTIGGNRKVNVLSGGHGGDRINGDAGNDRLSGEAGKDTLTGGLGKDSLTGGSGADRFDFNSVKETLAGSRRDVITDFKRGVDKIDLSTIDAEKGSGNQRFHWVERGDLDARFTGEAGELRLAGRVLMGDTNGDRKADFEILLSAKLAPADVLL